MSGAGPQPRAPLLGFDFGLQRIGVAVGEREPLASFPLVTLGARRGQPDWPAIAKLLQTWQPQALVVGVPVHLDGTEQAITRAARRFARQLRQRYHLPVHEADERLTTRQALGIHAAQRQAGKRGRNTGGDKDKIAASLILNEWLQANAP